MRRLLVLGLVFSLYTGCAPATPTALSPTPTSTPIIENPPPCWGGEMIYHTRSGQMLLLNCVPDTVNKETPNIIWSWDGNHWQKLAEGGPSMRILGGVAYDQKRNKVVLYGGRPVALGQCNRETWEWDSQAWTKQEADPPTACDHVRMVYDASSEEVILFSGLDESEKPVNETWAWNGEAWKLLSDTGPESRGHFGFVFDPNHEQVLLYGGYTSTVMDDFWVWKDNAWQEIDFPGPGKLSHFGMANDTGENALYIFAGATSSSTFSSLTNKTWRLTGGRWREVSPETSPAERGSPAMNYDPERKKIVLYGGFDSSGNDLNDTWEWDGSQWSCMANCQ